MKISRSIHHVNTTKIDIVKLLNIYHILSVDIEVMVKLSLGIDHINSTNTDIVKLSMNINNINCTNILSHAHVYVYRRPTHNISHNITEITNQVYAL